MKNLISNFRVVFATMAAISIVVPQTTLAKGPGGGGGASHSVSHASSSASINTQFSSKSLKTQAMTPSIPIPPPSGSKLGNLSTTAGSASTVSALQKANQSGIIIIGGKSTLPTDVSSQTHSTSLATTNAAGKNTVPTNISSQAHSTALATTAAKQTKTTNTYDQVIAEPGDRILTTSDGDILIGPDGAILSEPPGYTVNVTNNGYQVITPLGGEVDVPFNQAGGVYAAGNDALIETGSPLIQDQPSVGGPGRLLSETNSGNSSTYSKAASITNSTKFTPGKVAIKSNLALAGVTGINNGQVVPAANGNTGITGSGLPNSSNSGSQAKPQQGNMKSKVVHAAGNGVTPVDPPSSSPIFNASPTTLSATSKVVAVTNTSNNSQGGGSATGSPILNNVFIPPLQQIANHNKIIAATTGTPVQSPAGDATAPAPSHPTKPMSPGGSVFGSGFGSDDSTTTASADSTTSTTATIATKAAAAGIDLVLEDVTLSAPATLVAGPAYTVKFRNQGTANSSKFMVGLFAGLAGKLTDDAPRAMVEVPALVAGERKEITLRLPQKSMKMIGADGNPTAFTCLFVGIDVLNTVSETDETNNTAVIDRTALETTAAN